MKMDKDQLVEAIEKLTLPVLESGGHELVDLQIRGGKGKTVIDILVDKKEGRIRLDECARINRAVTAGIETGNLIAHSYVVNVSSPGLDRPLKSPRDFQRSVGQKMKIVLSEPVEGKNEYAGALEDIQNETLILKASNGTIRIPLGVVKTGKRDIF